MKLSNLLPNSQVKHNMTVDHIALDSREITHGSVFFAVAGSKQHGLLYAAEAQQQGAVAIVYDPAQQGAELARNIAGLMLIAVEGLAEKLGGIATRFYANPAQHLNIIGITGTNGKTSCTQFLAQVMDGCGIIGTLGWGRYMQLLNSPNTTPDAFAVQKMLAWFVANRLTQVAMEVSSHGLEQGRVNAITFNSAIFNNLSHDHSDYHGSMEAYFQSKLRLFKWPGLRFVVINLDDAYAERIIVEIAHEVKILTYSLQDRIHSADSIRARNISYTLAGIKCDVCWQGQQARLTVALLGDFNLQNILAILAVLLESGKALPECLLAIQAIKPVIGRMECFTGRAGKPMVVVDYAHTPDALYKSLRTLRQHCTAQLSVVFGCGGERDKSKRTKMGVIAEQLADRVIVTDDNPRFENNESIIKQIIHGLKMAKVLVINNRKVAIEQSISLSLERDIVLIAGKGHEDYQEVRGVKYPFSDRKIVQELLAA